MQEKFSLSFCYAPYELCTLPVYHFLQLLKFFRPSSNITNLKQYTYDHGRNWKKPHTHHPTPAPHPQKKERIQRYKTKQLLASLNFILGHCTDFTGTVLLWSYNWV